MKQQYQRLVDAMEQIVGAKGTWQEKRDAFLSWAKDNAGSEVSEFLGWFEGMDTADL